MKRILKLFLVGFFFLYCSCTRYMFPSTVGNDVTYKVRPMVADSSSAIINFTAGVAGTDGFGNEGSSTLGFLSINRGHTVQNFNFSYGLLGYTGNVEKIRSSENNDYSGSTSNKRVYLPPFNKSTAGLGIQTSVGYHFTSDGGSTDFRIINWENSITREFGEYNSFRKSLYGDMTYKDMMVSRNEVLWTTGFSSEIIFHHRKNRDYKHAFKLFIGGSPDLYKSFDNRIKTENYSISADEIRRGNFQFTYFLKIKKFNLTAQTDLSHFSSSIGLGYTL